MAMMKAGVVHAQRDIRFEDIEKPVPQPGEVLVKVKFTGICGSDVPRVNGTACHYYPNVLGHEFSGTVEEVGEGVVSMEPGARVAGIPLMPCMKCEDCQRGNFSLCAGDWKQEAEGEIDDETSHASDDGPPPER